MRDAATYHERALNAFEAVVEDSAAELTAQLDAMSAEDLYDLWWKAERLAKVARTEWQQRTTRPAGEAS